MIEDRVGKVFIMVFTNGDLPTNPTCLRECVVCGELFTRNESREHAEMPCQPSPEHPLRSSEIHFGSVKCPTLVPVGRWSGECKRAN